MSDTQGRNASSSGRHLAPDTARQSSRPEEEGRSRRRSAPTEEPPRRRSAQTEETPSRRRSAQTEETPSRRRSAQAEEAPSRRHSAPTEETPSRRHSAPRENKHFKRRKVFRTFLLVYLTILGLCTAYLQLRLWIYLDRSQAEMDQAEAQEKAMFQAPQLAFESWWDEQSGDDWVERCYAVSPANDLEPREWLTSYMERLFSPERAQAYKDLSYTAAAPVYLIKNGGQPLARVSLSGQDLNWTVSNVELLLAGDRTFEVTVPNSCTVTFNGQSLDPSLRQPAESMLQYDLLKDELQTPVTWVTYTAEGLLAEPEVVVTPPEGFELLHNDDGAYLLTLPGGAGDYANQAVRFVRAFLNYYMNGYHNTWYNRSTVLDLLQKDTQAYQEVMDTYESVSWASYYLDIDTSDTHAGDVIVWANNCFSVDVTYDADATMLGEAVDYANATMRVYYMRSGDSFYISHFETL